jgi:hypothetical protein
VDAVQPGDATAIVQGIARRVGTGGGLNELNESFSRNAEGVRGRRVAIMLK